MFELNAKQTEQSVLGGMMLNRRVVWEVADVLDPQDFADGRHEAIYRTILQLASEGAPTDVLAVSERMSSDGTLARAGGAVLLHTMTSEVPTAANAAYYAEAVRRAAIKRRLVETGMRITQLGNSTEGEALELVERARQDVDQVAGAARTETKPVGDSVDGVVASLHAAPRFTPTPWERLNGLVNGWRPGALYVIGARPGSGKTIMGLQAANHLAERGPVAFSSLEMDTADLTRRLFAMRGGIHMTSLTRNTLTPVEWQRIDHLAAATRKLPLYIDDRAGVGVTHVRSFARSVSRRGDLQGVVVDYLQLLRASDPRKPRWEAVGEMTAALKTMSRELDVPVIALCQLNRGTESGSGFARRLPTLGDLRESGSIEQDADVVMLLQRGWDEEAERPTDDLDVVIGKNRHGATGHERLLWEGQFARVMDPPW